MTDKQLWAMAMVGCVLLGFVFAELIGDYIPVPYISTAGRIER